MHWPTQTKKITMAPSVVFTRNLQTTTTHSPTKQHNTNSKQNKKTFANPSMHFATLTTKSPWHIHLLFELNVLKWVRIRSVVCLVHLPNVVDVLFWDAEKEVTPFPRISMDPLDKSHFFFGHLIA